MKQRPILYQGAMVRALLDGSKTQTRRIVKPQPPADTFQVTTYHHPDERPRFFAWKDGFGGAEMHPAWEPIACPYGQPGDQLWVREAWSQPTSLDPGPTFYRADYPACVPAQFSNVPPIKSIKWKPSIHMPRWVSRITLEITGVRVERLRNISEADAIAEGIQRGENFPGWYRGPLPGDSPGLEQSGRAFKIPTAFPKLAYRALWESINGPGSWDANPWVWVVEFKSVEGAAA